METSDVVFLVIMGILAFGLVLTFGSGFKMEDLPPNDEARAKVLNEAKDKPPADVAQPTVQAK
jgi:hypothetical protein